MRGSEYTNSAIAASISEVISGSEINGFDDLEAYADLVAEEDRPAPKEHGNIQLQAFSEIPLEEIDWLWDQYLPLGKLALLVGDPKAGKSLWSVLLASIVSSGGTWPDGTKCDAGDVVIVSKEDDVKDTIGPRIVAAGGDRSRIFRIVKDTWNPSSRESCQWLVAAIRDKVPGCKMIIMDPVITVGSKKSDTYNPNVIRDALEPVTELAEELHVCVLGISHFAKGTGDRRAMERVIGSGAYVQVTRSLFVCADYHEGGKIMVRTNANVSESGGGFRYDIGTKEVQFTNGNLGQIAAVTVGAFVSGEPEELLKEKPGGGKQSAEADDRALAIVHDIRGHAEEPTDAVKEACYLGGFDFICMSSTLDIIIESHNASPSNRRLRKRILGVLMAESHRVPKARGAFYIAKRKPLSRLSEAE